MWEEKLAGGPTQDEVLAVSLFKLGIRAGDTVLDCGCGTGKVSVEAAKTALQVVAIDKRPEAIRYAKRVAGQSGMKNIEFIRANAMEFLGTDDRIFDCAFIGGTAGLSAFLPILATRVRRTIVVNAVLLSTLETATGIFKDLGLFKEAVHIQSSRSHAIGGSIMFRPNNPVYIISGNGAAC